MIVSPFFRLDSYKFPVTRDQTAHQKNDPHNALAVPRLQTVSDPFPLTNPIIGEMYKTPFDQTISDIIPCPVSVESLDDTQVEIDVYNYDTSPAIIQSFLFPDSSDGKLSFYQ